MEAVKVTFPDGHTSGFEPGPGVNLSGETLKELARVLFKPTPVKIEIIEVQNWDPETDSVNITEIPLPNKPE